MSVLPEPPSRQPSLPEPPTHPSEVMWMAARLLVDSPDAPRRLVRGHGPDAAGAWCVGHVDVREHWPCSAARLAALVRQMQVHLGKR